jgi:hypothetical protein
LEPSGRAPSRIKRAGALGGRSFAALDSGLRVVGRLGPVGDCRAGCRRAGAEQRREKELCSDQAGAFP